MSKTESFKEPLLEKLRSFRRSRTLERLFIGEIIDMYVSRGSDAERADRLERCAQEWGVSYETARQAQQIHLIFGHYQLKFSEYPISILAVLSTTNAPESLQREFIKMGTVMGHSPSGRSVKQFCEIVIRAKRLHRKGTRPDMIRAAFLEKMRNVL